MTAFDEVCFQMRQNCLALKIQGKKICTPFVTRTVKPEFVQLSFMRMMHTARKHDTSVFMAHVRCTSEEPAGAKLNSDSEDLPYPANDPPPVRREKIRNSLLKNLNHLSSADRAAMVTLLEQYLDVFCPDDELPLRPLEKAREFEHVIDLVDDARPYSGPLYQMSEVELTELKKLLRMFQDFHLIQPSSSAWGAPILFSKKKDVMASNQ